MYVCERVSVLCSVTEFRQEFDFHKSDLVFGVVGTEFSVNFGQVVVLTVANHIEDVVLVVFVNDFIYIIGEVDFSAGVDNALNLVNQLAEGQVERRGDFLEVDLAVNSLYYRDFVF